MPRDIDGIIDDIDRLVDDQLDGGEPKRGYSFGDPTFPRCWHCGRHEHHLPITARIAAMYATGVYDEDYRAEDDDSPVLCQGSDFIGPMPAVGVLPYVELITDLAMGAMAEAMGLGPWMTRILAGIAGAAPLTCTARTWLPSDPPEPSPGSAVVVEIGDGQPQRGFGVGFRAGAPFLPAQINELPPAGFRPVGYLSEDDT